MSARFLDSELSSCYFSSFSTSTHEANFLKVVIKNNLRSSALGLLLIFILHTLSEEINFSKCAIGNPKNNLYGVIQSTAWYMH